MRARLESDIGRTAAGLFASSPQGMGLGMSLTRPSMPTFTDQGSSC
jgi:hypothetical protein